MAKIDLIFGVVATAGDWCWSYEAFGCTIGTNLFKIVIAYLFGIRTGKTSKQKFYKRQKFFDG